MKLAKTASVINFINQRARQKIRANRYLSLQTITLIQHLHAHPITTIGATLMRVKVMRIHFFHQICNLARPVETPLCKICSYSYTSRSMNRSTNDYIFKMKDLERFLGRQGK